MAYLELSKEAYNDLIMAAGIKGSKVAKVCETQGVWSEEAMQEAPPNVEPEHVQRSTYNAGGVAEPEPIVEDITEVPEAEEGDQLEDWDREEVEMKQDEII